MSQKDLPENVKNKFLHFNAVGCGGLDDVALLVDVGDLLLGHVVLQVPLVGCHNAF